MELEILFQGAEEGMEQQSVYNLSTMKNEMVQQQQQEELLRKSTKQTSIVNSITACS